MKGKKGYIQEKRLQKVTTPLPEKELLRIAADFYGKGFTEASPAQQKKILDAYRKVEQENFAAIRKAGSVEKWYATADRRLYF